LKTKPSLLPISVSMLLAVVAIVRWPHRKVTPTGSHSENKKPGPENAKPGCFG
jgi:hypothetical protein